MKTMPKFSIIIPVYNSAGIIERCVTSIAKQKFSDFELVLVDDGSKDDSYNVIKCLLNKLNLPSAKIIRQENAGAGAARNRGIEEAVGDYIVFVDSDDYLNDDYLLQINSCIEKDFSDIVFVDIVRELNNGTLIRHESMSDFSQLSKDDMIRCQLTGKMPWGGVRKVVRRRIVLETGARYATSIKVGEESIYSFLILNASNVISFQPKAIYHYVETSTSLTSNDDISLQKSVFDFIRNHLDDQRYNGKYSNTLASLAVTAILTGINIVSKKSLSYSQYKYAKKYVKYYEQFVNGDIDKLALENRVKICLPLIQLRLYMLLYIISYVKNLIHK